ncbi:MAG TPA: DUF4293 family protein [Bacteroidales bacterium]|nr:DUF4293 family protein [Bacteroidales bacterium]
MIQRKQTLYLLLTTILSVLFLSNQIITATDTSFFTFTGYHQQGSNEVTGYIYFTALLIAVPLLSAITIFVYQNRKLQLRLTMILIILIIVLCGVAVYLVFSFTGGNIILRPKLILPALMLVFSFKALGGIKKDEAIVRSYDRLR